MVDLQRAFDDAAQKTDVVRSFTDLRRFAADPNAGVRVHPASQGDAFLGRRRHLPRAEAAPVEVGVIDLPTGEGEVQEVTAHEYVIVCSGGVRFMQQGRSIELREGQSAVLPPGTRFSWHCERGATLIYMRQHGGPVGSSAILPIDEAAPLEPSAGPLSRLLIGPAPECRNHTDYRSADGVFTCGTWDSTPYRRHAMLYRHCELMYLLEGAVTLEDESGSRHIFTRHDIFVLEQGAQCSWESREHVKKVYAIYRPA